ncbi:MAG: hypothetical protein A2X86_11880 [Bdellovibrionales bacterium GWA2_49_15]|nr:MAG: hypothetical protein A2X86_11880 [Bdellovibrionales bacterium GWA2_49_15]HAZ12549.1 hypothetical protein [Bdellovibrionales bacterium]
MGYLFFQIFFTKSAFESRPSLPSVLSSIFGFLALILFFNFGESLLLRKSRISLVGHAPF